MRYLLALILLASFAFAKPVLLVMDISGSMDDALASGETKIDAAKQAAARFISNSQGTEIGLMKFSYCTDTYDAPDPAQGDIRIVEDFTTDKTALQSSVSSLYAAGDTPIAAALEEAVVYFQQKGKRDGVIILLSDGEETCGGDPEAAAKRAYDEGYAVVNVIAYDIDPTQLEYAERIARAGGGKMYTAANQAELESALTQASGSSSFPCCFPTLILGSLVGLVVLQRRK